MLKKTAIVLLCLTILAGTMCMTVSAAGNEGTAYLLDLNRSYSCFSRYVDDDSYTFKSLSWTEYGSPPFYLNGYLVAGDLFPTTCTFVNLGVQDMANGFIRVPSGQTVVVSACVGLTGGDVTNFTYLTFGSRYSIGDADPIHVTKNFTFSSADRYSLVYYSLTNNTGQDITIKSLYYYAGLKGGLSTSQLMFDMKYKIVDDAEKVQQYIEEQTDELRSSIEESTDQITGSIDENTEEIKDSIDENTDEITDKMEELQQNEKDEANTQGNASADEVAGAIPDESQGFINGMSSLISAMSYNGTDAKWTFPKLYLPEIPGVMDRLDLTDEELEIDFGFWIQKLPERLLSIVQIVLTIALIVYCFKELYGTISYVLTLKKDGGSE